MLNVGDIVLAKVTGISDFGFFVSVGEYSGLCHISEVSNDFVDENLLLLGMKFMF